MNSIKAKLHSNSGISIVFAILFLLVVTVVCSVMLATASANLSRIGTRQETRQEYLTLTSFADILIEGFGDMEYNELTYTYNNDAVCATDFAHAAPAADTAVFTVSGDFADNFQDKLEEKIAKCQDGVQTLSFQMEINGMPQYGKVNVTLTVSQDYTMKFRFHLDSDDYADYELTYRAYAYEVPGTVHESHSYTSGENTKECIYSYNYKKKCVVWKNPVFEEAKS